jgi:hypothetical protein
MLLILRAMALALPASPPPVGALGPPGGRE